MESRAVNAVGVWFYSVSTDRYLYLLRNDDRNPGTWGLPGGKCYRNETLLDAIRRECQEELGTWPETIKLVPIEKFTTENNNFSYHTFLIPVAEEFIPVLNEEHRGYCWVALEDYPRPLHPGVWRTVNFDEIMAKIRVLEQIL
jgi:8-oxo-dGTP pyrophosphatase MutT (NUDIX family)